MKARKSALLSAGHDQSQRISSLCLYWREGEEHWKRKLEMLMSMKAPCSSFLFFFKLDLFKIRRCTLARAANTQVRSIVQSQFWGVQHELWRKCVANTSSRPRKKHFRKELYNLFVIFKTHSFWGEVFSLYKCLYRVEAWQEMGFLWFKRWPETRNLVFPLEQQVGIS